MRRTARRLMAALLALLLAAPPARAADGSGTNAVSPTTAVSATAGLTFTFTFTAAEGMDSGGLRLSVPAGWSAPQGTGGTAGYTTASSQGELADVLDTADSATGWAAGTACTTSLALETTTKHEGSGAISCVNGNEASGDVWYKNISAQDWSGYTKVGFWIYSSGAIANNRLLFSYDDSANLASPLETLNIGALSAATWTYVVLSFGATTRTSVASYGFQINHVSGVDNLTVIADDFLLGPGAPAFSGSGPWNVDLRLLQLANAQTVTLAYGSGGGSSGATAPSTSGAYTFTTASRVSDAGTLTNIAASPSVTVSDAITTGSSGTQVTRARVGATAKFLGGAFTLQRNNGSTTVTSLVVTEGGTVNANANLSNLKLYYDSAGSCATADPAATATAFNGTGVGFNASEKAAATGSMTVGTTAVCVYVVADVGSGAAAGQTLELSIADPSSEVTASAGLVQPGSAVSIAGATTLELPDLSWATGSADFTVWNSASLSWGSGTLLCSGTLTDASGVTVACGPGRVLAGKQYRVQMLLKNLALGDAAMQGGSEYVDLRGVKGGWGGSSPTLGGCAFNDVGADDGSTTCAAAFNGNDVRLTNTGAGAVVVGESTGSQGFSFLLTTDADVPVSPTPDGLAASIDGVSQTSSKVNIGGPVPLSIQGLRLEGLRLVSD